MLTRLKADFSKREKLLYDARVIEFSENTETFDFGGDEMVAFTSSIQDKLQYNGIQLLQRLQILVYGKACGQKQVDRQRLQEETLLLLRPVDCLPRCLLNRMRQKIGNAKTNLAIGYTEFFKEVNKLIKKYYTKEKSVCDNGKRAWMGSCLL